MHVMRPFDCIVRMLMLGMRPFGQHLSCIADEHACFLADVKSKMSKQKSDRLESLKAASNQAAAPHPEPVGKTNLEDSFKGVARFYKSQSYVSSASGSDITSIG